MTESKNIGEYVDKLMSEESFYELNEQVREFYKKNTKVTVDKETGMVSITAPLLDLNYKNESDIEIEKV